MRFRTLAFAGLGFAIHFCGADTARADVISTTATLPILNAAYFAVGGGPDCFSAAGLCLTNGSLLLTPPVSTAFTSDEDILSGAEFMGELTDLGGTPLGSVTMSGTVEQNVIGRSAESTTGSWTVDLKGLSLSGTALGDALSLSLDPSATSSGNTAIVPSGGDFLISSFFDVSADLGVNSAPLATGSGAITFEAVPEPMSLLVLMPTGLALLAARRRSSARV